MPFCVYPLLAALWICFRQPALSKAQDGSASRGFEAAQTEPLPQNELRKSGFLEGRHFPRLSSIFGFPRRNSPFRLFSRFFGGPFVFTQAKKIFFFAGVPFSGLDQLPHANRPEPRLCFFSGRATSQGDPSFEDTCVIIRQVRPTLLVFYSMEVSTF